MNILFRFTRVAAFASLAVLSTAALADFSGQSVQVSYYLEDTTTAQTAGSAATVDGTVEYNPFTVTSTDEWTPSFDLGTIDFVSGSADRVVITFSDTYMLGGNCAGLCSFDGISIGNLSSATGFSSYTATLTQGQGTLASLSMDPAGAVWLNFANGTAFTAGDNSQNVVEVTLTPTSTSPVPEPESAMLMLVGMAGLWGHRHMRRRG